MIKILIAYFGTITCGVFYNTPLKKLPIIGFLGVISWISYNFCKEFTNAEIFSIFVGSFLMGVCSEIMARIMKTPALLFTSAGAIPLMPGFSTYSTAKFILENKFTDAAYKGVYTIACAGSIALGIMIATAIFRIIKDVKEK